MKNMEKKNIEKIVARYSGMAAAVLGAQGLQAQQDSTIYTDINDTTLSTNGAFYDFNINNDTSGIMDYRITQLIDSTNNNITGIVIEAMGNAGNQVMGIESGNYNYPFKLNAVDTIGPGKVFQGINPNRNVGYLAFEINGITYPNSQFTDTNGTTDGFLGLRFNAVENDTLRTFYGWIRLDVGQGLRSVTIKDFAYNAKFGNLIEAAGGSNFSIVDFTQEFPKMVQRGQYLDITIPGSFKPSATIKMIGLNGSLVKEIAIKERKTTLPLEGLPKGVMIAIIESNGIEASQKVVVY